MLNNVKKLARSGLFFPTKNYNFQLLTNFIIQLQNTSSTSHQPCQIFCFLPASCFPPVFCFSPPSYHHSVCCFSCCLSTLETHPPRNCCHFLPSSRPSNPRLCLLLPSEKFIELLTTRYYLAETLCSWKKFDHSQSLSSPYCIDIFFSKYLHIVNQVFTHCIPSIYTLYTKYLHIVFRVFTHCIPMFTR